MTTTQDARAAATGPGAPTAHHTTDLEDQMSTTPARAERAARAAEAAARNVPNNPRPLCTSFVEQPEPSAFWCGRCHWNRPMHDSDVERAAIAAELERLTAAGGAR
ncbi:hypothetical protein [Streptomyces sp. MP131-18]|uniref:hypothetical protein n=1 Tax=Streptomyces sp. MP131-18 TaxID=1857892 RepID=UPI00097C6432|nr:hypothetical protein [Streptomyces sp. MP131-18]ONK09485.1 hypothetical protein STBA_01850 [Streptomyces sp. MP131-18]